MIIEYNHFVKSLVLIAIKNWFFDGTMQEILAKIEGLLFVSSCLVSLGQLSRTLEISESVVKSHLLDLEQQYKEGGHGLRLMRVKNKYQLTTDPVISQTIEKFLGLQAPSILSQAALETLAIVAYKQPVTRPQVDVVRGVNSDSVMRSLLSKGLIEELGRAETPGRPIYYGTSPAFLQYFGLASIDDLPFIDFNELEENNENGSREVLKT